MILQSLDPDTYEILNESLKQRAWAEPLDASYKVAMTVDDLEYVVKVQPEPGYKIAVLQALRIDRDPEGPNFELITKPSALYALLQILLKQEEADSTLFDK